jgi:transposase
MLGDLVAMNRNELERLALMRRIEDRGTNQRMVAEQLGLSTRQVERLYRAYKAAGAAGLVSGKRGRRSNRLVPEDQRHAALQLVRVRYADFGPTLAHEKFAELHGCTVSPQTLRNARFSSWNL